MILLLSLIRDLLVLKIEMGGSNHSNTQGELVAYLYIEWIKH